jgi:site-specific DNA recombinase
MIEKIKASKEPVGILAWHPDRLARNSIDGGQIIYLIDTGQICSLKFPSFWFEPTPQGIFSLNMAFCQSKYYSDNLSENVTRGIRNKIRRGEWTGMAPLGYINNPITRNIEPHPVKSKIIKHLFENYANGQFSLNSAREKLQLLGIESRNRNPISLSAMGWVLTNPLYYGVIKHNEEYHEGKFEPLITRELFENVQARLKDSAQKRHSNQRHGFGFTGLLKCGECGCSISAQFAKGNGGTYIYYRCTKKKGKCSQSYLREDLVKDQFLKKIQKIRLPEGWAGEMLAYIDKLQQDQQQELILFAQNLKELLKETEAKLDKLINAFLEGIIEKEVYLEKKEALINEKQSLRDKKASFGRKGLLWLEPLRKFVQTTDRAGKLNLLSEFSEIKEVLEKSGTNRVMRDKKICMDFKEPFSYINNHKGSGAMEGYNRDTLKEETPSEIERVPVWWCPLESNQ